MVDPDLGHLRRISEALDGEGPMPDPLGPDGEAFLAAARRVRAGARVEEAAVPPDVTDAVLARLHAGPTRSQRAPGWAARRASLTAVAAIFVVAALVAALAARPGGPLAPVPATADVGADVLRALHDVVALDATVTLVERGVHPDVPERTYRGSLRYQAPERLWLHLEDRTTLPDGFPANDLDLVVDRSRAWSTGLRGCPVGDQPGCLRPDTRVVEGLAPFAADWVAPLDLVVPADAFLPHADTSTTTADGAVVVETTVARLQRTLDGLRTAGAVRAVHPTDRVRLELDDTRYTIRRLVVSAGDSGARTAWAASNGYVEVAGTDVLDLRVREEPLPSAPFPSAPPRPGTDAGFDDTPVDGPAPAWLPDGFSAHRTGVQTRGSATVAVRSWTDGRAWIRLDAARGRSGTQLLGDLGPLVRRIPVGDGTGHADPAGTVVSLRAGDLDVAVTGSVPLAVLVRVAASLPVTGRELPDHWPQGGALRSLPAGALRTDGPLVARYDGPDLVVAVPGPGRTSALLRQRPGTSLGAPSGADVAAVAVRGVTGRYEPAAGRIRWVEDGWVRELRSDGLGLDELLGVAEALR